VASALSVFASQGIPQAALRFVPRFRAKGQWNLLVSFLRHGALRLAVGGAAIAVAGVLFFLLTGERPGIDTGTAAAMGLVVLFALAGLLTETLRGLGLVVPAFAPHQFLVPLLWGAAAAAALLLHAPPRAETALVLLYGTVAVGLAWQTITLLGHLPERSSQGHPSFDPGWLAVSRPLFASTLVMALLDQAGIILLGILRGPEEVGIFTAAAKIAALCGLILTAVNALAAPRYAALHAQGRREAMQDLARSLAHFIFWPTLLLAGLVIAASPFLLLLFGNSFANASFPILLLLPGHLFNAATGSVGYLADLTGLHRQAALIHGGCAALAIPAMAVLIHHWGLAGAALGTSLGMIAWNIGLSFLVASRLGVHPSIWAALQRGRE